MRHALEVDYDVAREAETGTVIVSGFPSYQLSLVSGFLTWIWRGCGALAGGFSAIHRRPRRSPSDTQCHVGALESSGVLRRCLDAPMKRKKQ